MRKQLTLIGKEIYTENSMIEISWFRDNKIDDLESQNVRENKKGFIPKEYGLKDVEYRRDFYGNISAVLKTGDESEEQYVIAIKHDSYSLSYGYEEWNYENPDNDEDEDYEELLGMYWRQIGKYKSIKHAVKRLFFEFYRTIVFPEKIKISTSIKCHDITKWI